MYLFWNILLNISYTSLFYIKIQIKIYILACKTYWDVPKLLYLSITISILNVSRPIRTHNDDQRGHRSRGSGRVRPSGKSPSFSREQSNITKSFLINSLRIARRVQTEIRVCRTRIYTRGAIHLYTRFPRRTEDWYVLVEERRREKNDENKVA